MPLVGEVDIDLAEITNEFLQDFAVLKRGIVRYDSPIIDLNFHNYYRIGHAKLPISNAKFMKSNPIRR